MRELERSLQQSLEADVASFLEPFDALEHDVEYWSKALEGQEAVAVPGVCPIFMRQTLVPQ